MLKCTIYPLDYTNAVHIWMASATCETVITFGIDKIWHHGATLY